VAETLKTRRQRDGRRRPAQFPQGSRGAPGHAVLVLLIGAVCSFEASAIFGCSTPDSIRECGGVQFDSTQLGYDAGALPLFTSASTTG